MCRNYRLKLEQIQKRAARDDQEKEQQPITAKTATNLGWLSILNQEAEGLSLLPETPFGEVHLRQNRTVENKDLAKC